MSLEERLAALDNDGFDVDIAISEGLVIRLKKKPKSESADAQLEIDDKDAPPMALYFGLRFVNNIKRASRNDKIEYQYWVDQQLRNFQAYVSWSNGANNVYLEPIANAAMSHIAEIDQQKNKYQQRARNMQSWPVKAFSAAAGLLGKTQQHKGESEAKIEGYYERLLAWSILYESSQRFMEDLKGFKKYADRLKRPSLVSAVDRFIEFYGKIAEHSEAAKQKFGDFFRVYQGFCDVTGIEFRPLKIRAQKDKIIGIIYSLSNEVPADQFGVKLAASPK